MVTHLSFGGQLHNEVLRCLREAGFSIEMATHAHNVLDAYIYGFTLLEKSLQFKNLEDKSPGLKRSVCQLLEDDYPSLVEAIAGHANDSFYLLVGEFEFGLSFILDGLEKYRDTTL